MRTANFVYFILTCVFLLQSCGSNTSNSANVQSSDIAHVQADDQGDDDQGDNDQGDDDQGGNDYGDDGSDDRVDDTGSDDTLNDVTAPTVSGVNPYNGETNIGLDVPVTVSFDEDIDASSLTSETFYIKAGDQTLEGAISWASASVFNFTPSTPFLYGTTYEAFISGEVSDLAGNKITYDYIWSFTPRPVVYDLSIIEASSGGLDSSIEVDSNNNLHIAYWGHEGSTYYNLMYATNESGTFTVTALDTSGRVGRNPSIAVDNNNKVHISYFSGSTSELKYATNESGEWVDKVIDTVAVYNAGNNPYASIDTDSNNNAHIAYYCCYDFLDRHLKYATNASGSWATESVNTDFGAGKHVSIALDSNDKVHMSYFHAARSDLYYTTNKSDRWVHTGVDVNFSSGSLGQGSSLKIDSQGYMHISYYDATNVDVKYATNKSGSWVIELVYDVPHNIYYHTELALDSSDNAHITYTDITNRTLIYSTNIGGQWLNKTFDDIDIDWYGSAIAVDNFDDMHIIYYDYLTKKLGYVKSDY